MDQLSASISEFVSLLAKTSVAELQATGYPKGRVNWFMLDSTFLK